MLPAFQLKLREFRPNFVKEFVQFSVWCRYVIDANHSLSQAHAKMIVIALMSWPWLLMSF